mgnify:CR=1 FL=1
MLLRKEVSNLEKESIKVMARNREAYHEYFVEEEMEAGIELCGTEAMTLKDKELAEFRRFDELGPGGRLYGIVIQSKHGAHCGAASRRRSFLKVNQSARRCSLLRGARAFSAPSEE